MKVGGVWRFDKKEIDAWLRSQQRKFIPKPSDKN
jgi:hypothetical protein